MSIEINPISVNDFKTAILNNKDAVIWFIWYTRHKVEGIEFKSIYSNQQEIGVCFFIDNNDSTEVGILIHQAYRHQGYGSLFIQQLIQAHTKPLKFIVSKHNRVSMAFFEKFVSSEMLKACQDGDKMVFKTID